MFANGWKEKKIEGGIGAAVAIEIHKEDTQMATQIMKGTYKAVEVPLPDLARLAIESHGGLERWKQFEFLTARLVQGGVLWGLKGKAGVLERASVKLDLRKEWATHWPFAPTDYRSSFTPQRVAIETRDGQVIEELLNPRESFKGYEMETPWSNPQVAYFAGYTMWTYLTSPFILTQPGVVSEEIQSWEENGQTWRRLRVRFPDSIATHSAVQTFYFDRQGLLRRHDYEVDIQGSNRAARYVHDLIDVSGIILPTKMRVFSRRPDNQSAPEPLIVSVDLTDFLFE
jgi:hypothetical protein